MIKIVMPPPPVAPCGECGELVGQTNLIERTRIAPRPHPKAEDIVSRTMVCLPCWYNPGGRELAKAERRAPKPARVFPYGLDEARARSEVVRAHFGWTYEPEVRGDADRGYVIVGDSEIVPGFKAATR